MPTSLWQWGVVAAFVVAFILGGMWLLRSTHAAATYANVYGLNGLCLENYQGVAANGNRVILDTCNTSASQKWSYNSNGTITNSNGYCLSVGGGGTSDGTPVHIYTCDGHPGQQWVVTRGVQAISNPHSGRCLDLYRGITTGGGSLQIWGCNSNPQQNWTFGSPTVHSLVSPGVGTAALNTSKCVRGVGPFTTNRANIVQGDGTPFVPSGITLSTLQAYPTTQFGTAPSTLDQLKAQIAAVANNWCANTVRLQIEQDALAENVGGYLKTVQDAVTYAKSLGLVVVLNAQTEPATALSKNEPFPTSETVTFWRILDNLYANDPQVVYDLFNEPRPGTLGLSNESDRWNFWKNGGTRSYSYNGHNYTMTFIGAQALADAVRRDGSHNLFWVESNETDDLLDYMVADPGTYLLKNVGSVVYSYHHPKQDSSTWDAKFGNLVKNNVAPIVDGEWVNFAVSSWQCWSNAPTTVPQYLAYLQSLGVGLTGWTLGWAHVNGVGYGFMIGAQNLYDLPNTYKSNWACTDALGQGMGKDLQNWLIQQNGAN